MRKHKVQAKSCLFTGTQICELCVRTNALNSIMLGTEHQPMERGMQM